MGDEIAACSRFGKLLDSIDEERSRLARHLHDDLAQNLAVISMHLARGNTKEVSDCLPELRECQALLEHTISDVRAVSCSLEQPLVAELGLKASLEAFAERWNGTHGIPLKLNIDASVQSALSPAEQPAVFRIIRDSAEGLASAGAVNVIATIKPITGALGINVLGECGSTPVQMTETLFWLIIAERASRHGCRPGLIEGEAATEIEIMLPREKGLWAVAH